MCMQPPARGVADGYAASPPLAASSLGCAQVIRFPPRSLVWLLARGLRFPAPANLCMHLPVSIRSHSPASLPCRPVNSQVRWNWAACASERGVRGGGARKPAQHVPPLEHPGPSGHDLLLSRGLSSSPPPWPMRTRACVSSPESALEGRGGRLCSRYACAEPTSLRCSLTPRELALALHAQSRLR